MEGMGQSQGGTRPVLVTIGAAVAFAAVLALLVILASTPAEAADANTTDLPDLVIGEVYNLTEVYLGEDIFFNVTIENHGTAPFLKKSGVLEIFAYRDSETDIAGWTRVYWDIFHRDNVTVNVWARFNSLGNHTLRVVLDPSDNIDELDEGNNEFEVELVVVPSQENRPPKADGGNDRYGYVDEALLFSARYSDDPDGDDLTYSWTFGDGAEGSGRFTNHTYLYKGTYASSLMVSDGDKIDIDSFIVTVIERPVNHPPTARIHVATSSIHRGEELTFDGRTSTDPDFDRLVYDWDFDATDGVDDWVRGAAVVRRWDEVGAYVVTLMVSDGFETSTDSVTISVTTPPPPNVDPKAKAGPDIETRVGKRVQLLGEGTDPDGHIVSWEWDLDGDGNYDTYSDRDGTVSQSFDTEGIYTLRLRVTDNRGGTATDSIIVTVEKAADGNDDTPGPSAILTLVTLMLIGIFVKTRSGGGAGGGIRGEKGGPSFKYGQ